jgi:hypothetical protein
MPSVRFAELRYLKDGTPITVFLGLVAVQPWYRMLM